MFLCTYGIKLYIHEALFYQSVWCRGLRRELSNIFDFMLYGYGVRVLWNRFFFQFVIRISISLMIVMLNYAFTHMLFSLRILHLAVEM